MYVPYTHISYARPAPFPLLPATDRLFRHEQLEFPTAQVQQINAQGEQVKPLIKDKG